MYTLTDLKRAASKAEIAGDIESFNTINEAIVTKKKDLEARYGPAKAEGSDAGFFENVATGFGSGAVGMVEVASLGGAAFYEEEEELEAREKIQRVADSFRPEGGDKDSLTYGISSALGSVAAMAAVPIAAAYAGAPVALGTGLAALTGVAASRGTASERARAAGATEKERNTAINSILVNASGALEALPMGRVFKSIDVPVLSKFLDKISPEVAEGISGRIKNMAISGGLEGAQEASAEIAQNLTEQEYNALAETFGGTAESFGYGAAAGAILDLFLGRRKRGGIEDRDIDDTELGADVIAEEEARLIRGTELEEEQIDMFSTELDAEERADINRAGPPAPVESVVEEKDEGDAPEQLDMLTQLKQSEFERRQQESRDARGDTQGDLFSAELEEAELAELEATVASENSSVEDVEVAEKVLALYGRKKIARERKKKADAAVPPLTQDGDIVDAARYEELQDKQIAERTAAEDVELAEMQRQEDAAKDAENLEVERLIIDDENKAALQGMEAQVKERKAGEPQQLPLEGIQSKTDVKKRGARRTAAQTGDVDSAAKTNIPERRVVAQEEQVDQTGPTESEKVAIASNLTALINKNKKEPSTEIMAGRLEKSIAKDQKRTAAQTGEVSDTSSQEAAPAVRTLNPKTNKFRFKDSNRFITPHKVLDQDMQKLDTLAKTEFGQRRTDVDFTDAAIAGRVQAKTVGKYISQFDTPADALINAVSEVSDPKNKMYREPNEAKEKEPSGTLPIGKDPLAKNLAGTGGANAQAVLSWAKDNLSAETNAQLDVSLESAKNRIAESEKSVKARESGATDVQLLKDREAKAKARQVEAVEKTTPLSPSRTSYKGKVKVVPERKAPVKKTEPSPTVRADKATKKKATGAPKKADIVRQGIENIQGSRGKNAKAPLTEDMSPAQVTAKIKADVEIALAAGIKIDVLNLELDPKVAVALDAKLPTEVKALLKKGDLKGALQSLSKSSTNKRVKQIARALSENTGTTKIEIANTADIQKRGYDTKGEEVTGLYDPAINTIILNSNLPLTVHALLHETTHAATINILKNKSHPLTKQMNKLYGDVKPYLGTAYGTKNLNEFIAEAFSNPKFQQELAKINVKGEPISALERFYRAITNYVRRLIGMDTKPVNSALDAADGAIMGMLSPTVETRGGGVMYMNATKDGVQKVLGDIDEAQRAISSKFSKNAWAKATYDFFNDRSIGTAFKIIKLKLSNSQILGDTARGQGFGQLGLDLHTAIESQIGDIQMADAKVEKVINDAKAWVKKAGPKAYSTLNRVIYNTEYGATIYQVDPTLSISQAKAKYENVPSLDPNRTKFEVWKQNQKEWVKLKDNGGQNVFNQQRAQYKKMYTELLKTINGQIDDLVGKDSDASIKLKQEVFARMFAAGDLEVYFPLVRQGNFKISFDAKIRDASGNVTSTEPVFLMYEHKSDRDQAILDLENDPDVVGKISSFEGEPSRERFDSAPSGSFVANVLDVLKVNDVDSEVGDQVMRLFIDSLPETSFAQSLQRRTNTLGYMSDATLAMQLKGYSLSAQVERMKNSARIRNIEKQIKDIKVPDGVNNESFELTKKELLRRGKFARKGAENKEKETYYKLFNQVAFIYTIGFNASSALVNLSQIPLLIGPFLSGKFGTDQTFSAILEASRLVGGSSNSIINYYTAIGEGRDTTYVVSEAHKKKIRANNSNKADANKEIKKLEDLAPLVKLAKQQGMLQTTALSEVLNVSDAGRTKNSNPALRFLDNVSALSAIGFTAAERFNRQSTMIMSYTLVLNKMKDRKVAGKQYYSDVQGKFIDVPNGSQAIKELAASESMYLTQELNGGAVLETAPGWAQQGMGRVALMYKSYGLSMYYAMFKSMNMAWKNKSAIYKGDAQSKELLNTALQQAFGVHLSALFFAGVQGIPLYGAASMIADMFLDDDEDDADTIVRKQVGEGWYKGAVTKFTGADIASRVALTGLLLQDNRFNKDPSLEENIGKYFGGPALSVVNRIYRGVAETLEAKTSREYRRAAESLIPAGISNFTKATGRYSEEGIATRRANPIYDDMTGGEIFAQSLGFPPAEYTLRQEQNARNKGIEVAVVEEKSKLTTKYYVSVYRGDYGRASEILGEMQEFNKRHPSVAISNETINKSIKSHLSTTARMHNGVVVNPALQAAIEMSNREYRR